MRSVLNGNRTESSATAENDRICDGSQEKQSAQDENLLNE